MVTVPAMAHVWPSVAIGDELAARGHEVAWCGPETDLRPVVGPGMTIFPTGKRSFRPVTHEGTAALREVWDHYLLPLCRFMQEPVDQAVAEYQPDAILTDQYALAGALSAHKAGVPWASLCASALELTPPAEDPGLGEWVKLKLGQARKAGGLPDGDDLDLRFSPYLVLALTTRTLVGPVTLPENCQLIGAALGARRTDPAFDWDWWDPAQRHVLVTAGTLSGHLVHDYLARMIAAVKPLEGRVQVVINAAAEAVPGAPPHVLAAPRVPMLELMPRLDAVVGQGGQGSTDEALAYGVPLVIAPMRLHELTVAQQVTRSGAGLTVSFTDSTPDQLARAVSAVLDEPGYRARAGEISAEFAAAGGTGAAATQLAALAARR